MTPEQKAVVTQEYLKSRLHYYQDTGIFTWLPRIDGASLCGRNSWNTKYAGTMAGSSRNEQETGNGPVCKTRAGHD